MNKSIVSWILYDVANTIFNMGIVGLFLPLWINERAGTTDADLGFPIAISMAIVLLGSPVLGALTDQAKGRVRTFTVLNIVAATATFLIGSVSATTISLIAFSVAFICVYLAELIYNSMLEKASTEENRGKIGGIGIGLGYLGALAVILFALEYDHFSNDYGAAFQVLGVLFLLTALPITFFFFDSNEKVSRTRGAVLYSTWLQIKRTRAHFRHYPLLPKFFLARYFYMIAVATGSTFGVLYGLKTIGFSEREVELVMLLGIVIAIPASIIWGYIVDRIGPSTALKFNVLGWSLVLAGSVSIPWFGLNTQLWWPLSAFTAMFYGGLWVADRPLLIRLSPVDLGEMFGIYGAISRLASITGSIAWPFIAVNLGLGQPASVFFLFCCSIVGAVLLIRFQDGSQGKQPTTVVPSLPEQID
ncbi:MAG: MFS transporter [SAR202 cluster bacterium]|nr:MFS transporter [SAR202 cluster bacterium]